MAKCYICYSDSVQVSFLSKFTLPASNFMYYSIYIKSLGTFILLFRAVCRNCQPKLMTVSILKCNNIFSSNNVEGFFFSRVHLHKVMTLCDLMNDLFSRSFLVFDVRLTTLSQFSLLIMSGLSPSLITVIWNLKKIAKKMYLFWNNCILTQLSEM